MKSSQPFFSVITCTYNSEQFLPENIGSVEAQDFKNFEHIFIDAFSTDKTVALIKAYQARRPEQVKFFQQPPQGISSAMNLGIEKASGFVIQHLHSDDLLYSPSVLGQARQIFEKSGADIVVGNCIFTGPNGSQPIWPSGGFRRRLQKHFFKNFLLFVNNLPHPSTFIKKQVFVNYGAFRENLKNVMDYELWLRVAKKVHIKLVDNIFSIYRSHPQTTSNLFPERAKAEIAELMLEYKHEYWLERAVNAAVFRPLHRLFKSSGVYWLK